MYSKKDDTNEIEQQGFEGFFWGGGETSLKI